MTMELAELAGQVHDVERAGGLTLDLPDGTVGYLVRAPRRDDCFAAALATALQVPIDEVPDSRLTERCRAGEDLAEISRSAWQELQRWLAGRGLRVVIHRKVPVRKPRWIGVVATTGWADHCMVMSWGRVLFDPTKDLRFAALAKILPGRQLPRLRVRTWGPEDVAYGLSFQSPDQTDKNEVTTWRSR
jgi:hypothetical protein